MQGHWQRFKEYIQKHQTDFGYFLLDMYNEPTYNFYIGLTDKLAEKFYLGISDNEIYFNITTRSSVTPVKNSFEYIKNHLDPNAELYIGTRKIL